MPIVADNIARLERRMAAASLGVGLLLLAMKFLAYLWTGSTAVFSDALESIINVLASALAWYSVVLAHSPADPQHPYGHGKVEFLSAGFEGGMMMLAALLIAAKSVQSLMNGVRLDRVDDGLALIAVAMAVNAVLGALLCRVGRRHGSISLEADGKHLLSDAVSSIVVLAALGAVKATGRGWIDPLGAFAVAGYVAWTAAGLLRRATAGLMDEQDVQDQKLLRQILDAHMGPEGREPRICSYHKLRHRHSGRYHWVDFHMRVPAGLDVRRAHESASAIEYEIEKALLEANATAHVEPCADKNCRRCQAEQGPGGTDG